MTTTLKIELDELTEALYAIEPGFNQVHVSRQDNHYILTIDRPDPS